MRSHDMEPGRAYVLVGRSRTKVTVLDTPPEVRRRARVRVRFESGLKAGEVSDLPSRRIAAAWDELHQPRKPLHPRRRPVAIERAPEVGDQVTWTVTGTLTWTLDHLDERSGRATISGVIFDQPTRRTVSVEQLQVGADEPGSPDSFPALLVDAPNGAAHQSPVTYRSAAPTTEHLRPEKPRRELEEILEDI